MAESVTTFNTGEKTLDFCFWGSHNAPPSPVVPTKQSEEVLTIRHGSTTLQEAENKNFVSSLAKLVRLL